MKVSQQELQSTPTFSTAIADAHNYMRWIIGIFEPYLNSDVLEVGVGHGSYFEYLSRFRSYRGIDIELENIARCRERYPQASFQVLDICTDAFRDEFPRASVDTIVCCNVIEHIENDRLAVTNLIDALRPGGHLLLLVPALQLLYGDLDRLAGHYRRYSKARMNLAIAGAPIEIIEHRYFNPIGGLAWLANRFVRHSSLDDSAVNVQIKIFDKYILPFSRILDPVTKQFFGQSLICVARKI
jgi:SAM-dependent methyltransferase